jgi:predicted MFS family arabinose efflux permease
LGGFIWSSFGYQYVFLMGAVIALINLFTGLRIRLPESKPI